MFITTRSGRAPPPNDCAAASPRPFRKRVSAVGTTNWSGRIPGRCTQIAFPSRMLALLLPWLMLNRGRLTVLLHPETGDDYRDHTAHAAWLGDALPLRLSAFKAAATSRR